MAEAAPETERLLGTRVYHLRQFRGLSGRDLAAMCSEVPRGDRPSGKQGNLQGATARKFDCGEAHIDMVQRMARSAFRTRAQASQPVGSDCPAFEPPTADLARSVASSSWSKTTPQESISSVASSSRSRSTPEESMDENVAATSSTHSAHRVPSPVDDPLPRSSFAYEAESVCSGDGFRSGHDLTKVSPEFRDRGEFGSEDGWPASFPLSSMARCGKNRDGPVSSFRLCDSAELRSYRRWRPEEAPLASAAAEELDGDAMGFVPRNHDGAVPSIGSVGHATGQCRPCLFLRKGCVRGLACRFCHLPHGQEDNHRRSKVKKETQKNRAGRLAGPAQNNPDSGDLANIGGLAPSQRQTSMGRSTRIWL